MRVSYLFLAGFTKEFDAVDIESVESKLSRGEKTLAFRHSRGSMVSVALGPRHILGSNV
jgi:hypothetical protein